jgi:membrane protease YdiL (CAAX protease family)
MSQGPIDRNIRPMRFGTSVLFFGLPTIVLFVATHWGVPLLNNKTGIPLVVCWFICGGGLVFFPLTVASFVAFRSEGNSFSSLAIRSRLRLRPMELRDWLWSLCALVLIGAVTQLLLVFAVRFIPSFSTNPSFMTMDTLRPGEMWILLAWAPLFLFNIIGEEFFWRGYVLPRQELAYGKWTWVVHGAFWSMFHIAFGWQLMFILAPLLFALPYVVQNRKNTWVGIVIHGLINGSGFLAVALGAGR